MVVLIGNLPKCAVEKDLCRLFGLTLGTKVRIVKKYAPHGAVQRFALIPVDKESHARRIIASAHGMEWQGHTLIAHEYQHRTGARERRRVDWRSQSWNGLERRLDERRSFAMDSRSLVA
ncbi:MAG: RNA-binding protein [Thiogranum sp.]|nr:RNA-binding protein [Thiogranum sp.]